MGATDHTRPQGRRLRRHTPAGFTLVELLITMAIAAILLGLAAPAMREFITKNHIAGVSNEFAGAVLAARGEAIRQNSCVSMCISTDTQSAQPTCSRSETDWQKGWLLFVNKSCDATTPPAATDILQARAADQAAYTMTTRDDKRLVTFTALGNVRNLGTTFDLRYGGDANYRHNRAIALSAQGRTTIGAGRPDEDK